MRKLIGSWAVWVSVNRAIVTRDIPSISLQHQLVTKLWITSNVLQLSVSVNSIILDIYSGERVNWNNTVIFRSRVSSIMTMTFVFGKTILSCVAFSYCWLASGYYINVIVFFSESSSFKALYLMSWCTQVYIAALLWLESWVLWCHVIVCLEIRSTWLHAWSPVEKVRKVMLHSWPHLVNAVNLRAFSSLLSVYRVRLKKLLTTWSVIIR